MHIAPCVSVLLCFSVRILYYLWVDGCVRMRAYVCVDTCLSMRLP